MDTTHPAEAAYMAAIRAGTDWYSAADAWGGLFRYWRSRGLIHHVGFTRSRGKARNASVVGVWQGNDIA